MKKIYSFLSIFLVSSAFSQITLTEENVPSVGANMIYLNQINLNGISPGNAGANQTYDFAGWGSTMELQTQHLDPSGFPNADTSVTFVIQEDADTSTSYVLLSADAIEIVGMEMPNPLDSTGTPSLVVPDNPFTFLTFPSTYETAFQDVMNAETPAYPFNFELDSTGTLFVDSMKVLINIDASSIIDGWGEAITPFGYNINVLRQKVTTFNSYTFQGHMNSVFFGDTIHLGYQTFFDFGDTTITYRYLTDYSEGPMIFAEMETNYFGQINRGKMAKLNFLSTDDINKTNTVIYPNPVKSKVSIDSKETIEEITVMDLKGAKVQNLKGNTANQYDFSNLKQGTYILHIKTSNGVKFSKFVKE